eukprot:12355919-Ditylum_brightwellii.AAC.1
MTQQEEEIMTGATILIMFIITVHQHVGVMAGEDKLIMKVAVHIIMKQCLECKVQWNMRITWLEHKC